jgi:hypothetical protein
MSEIWFIINGSKMDHSENPHFVKIIFGKTPWSFEASGSKIEDGRICHVWCLK